MTSSPSKRITRDNRNELFKNRPGFTSGMLTDQLRFVSTLEKEHDSDRFLRAVVDACASSVAVLDESGKILYASKAWRLFERVNRHGSRRRGMLPDYFEHCQRISEAATGEHSSATLSDDIQRILNGEEKEFQRTYCSNSISEPGCFVTNAARLDLPGSAFRVLVNHDDVVIAKEALRKSEERLSQLLETTKILVWEAEPTNWRFTYVSKQAEEILGYKVSKWYESDFLISHIHRDDQKRALSICGKSSQLTDHHDLTFRMLAKDGRVVWVQNLISITRVNGQPTKICGFMIDISERKRAEEVLRDVGGRLIAAQEEERSRIARELHDEFSQKMALLSIGLEQLSQETQKSVNLRGRFQKLQLQAEEISDDIRRLSHTLHPSKLDHLGLASAVKGLCRELSERTSLDIQLKLKGFPVTLSKEVTLCAFRILQEALRNSIKHSGAQTLKVLIENADDTLQLSISDDGCGFDTKSEVFQKGLGFISMKERLNLVGGEVKIQSRPLRGTSISVSIPLVCDVDSEELFSDVFLNTPDEQQPLRLTPVRGL